MKKYMKGLVLAFLAIFLVSCSTLSTEDVQNSAGRMARLIGLNESDSARYVEEFTKAYENKLIDYSYDSLEDKYFIHPRVSYWSHVEVYYGIKPNHIWARMKLDYTSDSWLFMKSANIYTDNNKYETGNFYWDVKRDVLDGGRVKEYVDLPAGDGTLAVMKELFNSKNKRIVRLIGDEYYEDQDIPEKDIPALNEVIDLYYLVVDSLR